jgi:hypothetical protein
VTDPTWLNVLLGVFMVAGSIAMLVMAYALWTIIKSER